MLDYLKGVTLYKIKDMFICRTFNDLGIDSLSSDLSRQAGRCAIAYMLDETTGNPNEGKSITDVYRHLGEVLEVSPNCAKKRLERYRLQVEKAMVCHTSSMKDFLVLTVKNVLTYRYREHLDEIVDRNKRDCIQHDINFVVDLRKYCESYEYDIVYDLINEMIGLDGSVKDVEDCDTLKYFISKKELHLRLKSVKKAMFYNMDRYEMFNIFGKITRIPIMNDQKFMRKLAEYVKSEEVYFRG